MNMPHGASCAGSKSLPTPIKDLLDVLDEGEREDALNGFLAKWPDSKWSRLQHTVLYRWQQDRDLVVSALAFLGCSVHNPGGMGPIYLMKNSQVVVELNECATAFSRLTTGGKGLVEGLSDLIRLLRSVGWTVRSIQWERLV
jgi:hypothetical protein